MKKRLRNIFTVYLLKLKSEEHSSPNVHGFKSKRPLRFNFCQAGVYGSILCFSMFRASLGIVIPAYPLPAKYIY